MDNQKNTILAVVLSGLVLLAWQYFIATPPQAASRDSIIASGPRVRISTPTLSGSVSLKGGRLDDLSLVNYREKVDPKSPAIVLLSPSGSQEPFYAEFGWVGAPGAAVKLPGPDTEWKQEGSGTIGVGQSAKLVYDNGAGLEFHRTVAVDDKYLFTVT